MKRILIIRPSAIGDIVMASPMIRVLRNSWPQATIVWLADPSVRCLLDHHPLLDEVICWSKEHWRRLARNGRFVRLGGEIRTFSRDLRQRRFDLALDAQGLLRSRLLARLSGATARIGFASKEPGRHLMTRIVSRGPRSKEMSSEYRHLMLVLGLEPGPFVPEIVLSPADSDAARQIRAGRSLTGGYAVLCPFTTRPQKHWIEARWAETAAGLATQFGLAVALLGGPLDAAAARRIAGRAGVGITDLTGQTTLGQAAALVEQAALVIGVDTGLTHLGTAFKRPTIALFGATCPYLHTANLKTVVVYNRLTCSPCKRKPTCAGRYDCMKAIGPADVLRAVRGLLES
ncbi:MAG: glycosyltransferase family 9 protein [Desulfobacterales bacterium]